MFLDYDPKDAEKPIVETSSIDVDKLLSDKENKWFNIILNEEFNNTIKTHKYILYNFALEARLKLNKNPQANKLP